MRALEIPVTEMFPNLFSESIEKQVLASRIREEILTFLSKPRTKEQILYAFDFYINAKQPDAVFYFYEMLKRTNQTGDELLTKVEEKISAYKKNLTNNK